MARSRSRDDDETVTFSADVRNSTDLAYLLYDGDVEVWVPKSLIIEEELNKDETHGEFTMLRWQAEGKGLA